MTDNKQQGLPLLGRTTIRVAEHYLPVIFNDDVSGIHDSELYYWQKFTHDLQSESREQYGKDHIVFGWEYATADGDEIWDTCDVCELTAQVYDIKVHIYGK